MINNSEPTAIYVICIILLFLLIICAVLYLIRNKIPLIPPDDSADIGYNEDSEVGTSADSEKEEYVVSYSKVNQPKKDVYATNDGSKILTNQYASRSFKDMMNDIKSGRKPFLTDHDVDPLNNGQLDKVLAKGDRISGIMKKARNNEMLTRDEMRNAAMAYHEASNHDISLMSRALSGTKKLLLVDGAVPVLDVDEDSKDLYPRFDAAKSNRVLASDRIIKVKPYEFDARNPLGRDIRSTHLFRKGGKEDRVILNLATEGGDRKSRAMTISDRIYNVSNGKVSIKDPDGKRTDFNVGNIIPSNDNKYLVDVNANIISH